MHLPGNSGPDYTSADNTYVYVRFVQEIFRMSLKMIIVTSLSQNVTGLKRG